MNVFVFRPLPAVRRYLVAGRPALRKGQRGVALVVALVLLVVITLVGLAAVRGTIMQQKMTSNFYDRQLAFQEAEAALRQAEAKILSTPSATAFRDCSSGGTNLCLANPFASGSNISDSDIVTVDASSFDAGKLAASQPQYVIEFMGNFKIPDSEIKQVSNCAGYAACGSANIAGFYRITARSGPPSVDTQGRASVTLQSMFRK